VVALVVVIVLWVVSLLIVVRVAGRRLAAERRRRRVVVESALATVDGDAVVFDARRRVIAVSPSLRKEPTPSGVVGALGLDDDPVASSLLEGLVGEVLAGNSKRLEFTDDDASAREMRILEATGTPIGDGDSRWGMIHVVDATERRQRAMRSAQAERMESLGALAGGLAHDFNNLLFVTLGNLQLLATNDLVANDEKLSKFVSRSLGAVERGAEITKSLLAVARSQPLEERDVVLADLLKGILPLVRQALGTGRTVSVDIPDQSVHLMLDAGRLSSCILNLAFNARDAMGPTGTLSIAGRRLGADEIDPAWGLSGEFLALSLIDDGSGMPPDVAARAFEPFFTTKRAGSGTGLGLATVYAFAQQSGGTAHLSSQIGAGTTVTLVLPIHDPTTDQQRDAPRRRAGRRVVVADDEQSLAEMVAAWLIDVGVDARFATNPKAALQMVEELRPDLLVSDANFGEEMDGIELAKLATAIDPDLAVVFMTGYSASMRALQELGERTLAKPFSRDDLYAAVTPLLAEDPSRGDR